jgi:hypothetical protein
MKEVTLPGELCHGWTEISLGGQLSQPLRSAQLLFVLKGNDMTIKHVSNADGEGWLIVKWADGTTVPAIPQFLRVDFKKTENGRDFFSVVEGIRNGKEASVKRKAGDGSYLLDGDPAEPKATLKFDRKKGEFWFGGTGPVAAKTDPDNPTPLGTFDLEIPDEVHKIGTQYQVDSVFATTWFRVGHSGDRFLHPGRVSAGCVTITNIKKWTEIYEYLIKRRLGDDKSVGTIEIVE